MVDILSSPDLRGQIFVIEVRYGDQIYRYTNSPDGDELVAGNTYTRNLFTLSKLAASVTENAGDVVLTLPSDDPVVRIYDVLLPTEPVTCRIMSFEVNDPNRTPRIRKIGEVASVADKDDGTSELTIKPIGRGMENAIPSLLQQSTCVLPHYGLICGLSAELYRRRSNGLISLSGTQLQSTAFATTDPTYFKAGWLRCVQTRELRFVLDQQPNGVLIFSYPFSLATTAHDFDAWAGCLRTGDVCSQKFNNKKRAWMFEKIPTKNPWTSGIK